MTDQPPAEQLALTIIDDDLTWDEWIRSLPMWGEPAVEPDDEQKAA